MTRRPCWTGKRVLPDSVVKKLDDAIHKIMADREFQAKAKGMGLQIGYENSETFQKSIMRTKDSLLTFVKEEGLVKSKASPARAPHSLERVRKAGHGCKRD